MLKSGTGVKSFFKKNLLKLTLLLFVIILVVALILAIIFGGAEFYRPVKTYYDSIEQNDSELMHSVAADYWIKYADHEFGAGSSYGLLADLIDDFHEDYKSYGSELIIYPDIYRADKANEDELNVLLNDLYENYGRYVYKEPAEMNITGACVVSVSFTFDKSSDEDKHSSQFLFVKENGKWKIAVGRIDNPFFSNVQGH